jgi:hypothetical protein
LKKAGARLEKVNPAPAREADLEKILFPEVRPYFEEVVSLVSPDAFRPLLAVMKGKIPSPSEQHHLSSLVKQGFLVEEGEKVSCFSPAFLLFLRKCLSARMLKASC